MDIGDKVTWTHHWKKGRSHNFSTRKGRVVLLIGSKADVKYRGETYRIPLDRLRFIGERTELTEMVIGNTPNQAPERTAEQRRRSA